MINTENRVFAFLENIGRNHSDRVLPFNMWVDLPKLSVSPYYEILFVLQVHT